jgi:hypothetical protein
MRDLSSTFDHTAHVAQLPEWFVAATASARARRRAHHAASAVTPPHFTHLGPCSQCGTTLPAIPLLALRAECLHCGWRTPLPSLFTPYPTEVPTWDTPQGRHLWCTHAVLRSTLTPGEGLLCFGTAPALRLPLGWMLGCRRLLRRTMHAPTERFLGIVVTALCATVCTHTSGPAYFWHIPFRVGTHIPALGVGDDVSSAGAEGTRRTPHELLGVWPLHRSADRHATGTTHDTTPARGGRVAAALPHQSPPGDGCPTSVLADAARDWHAVPPPFVRTTRVAPAAGANCAPADTPDTVCRLNECELITAAHGVAEVVGGSAGARRQPPPLIPHDDVWGLQLCTSMSLWDAALAWLDEHETVLAGRACRTLRADTTPLFTHAPVLPLPVWDGVIQESEETPRVQQAWSHPAQPVYHNMHAVSSRAGAPFLPNAWARVFAENALCGPLVAWAFGGFPTCCHIHTDQSFVLRNPRFDETVHAAAVDWVRGQVAEGRMMAVPTNDRGYPMPPFVSSPIGAVPKEGGTLRIVHDFSRPLHASVNSFTLYSVLGRIDMLTLTAIANRALFLRETHPHGEIHAFKLDMRACYRQHPARARDRWHLGLSIGDEFYTHKQLMWGSSSAAHMVSLHTNAVCDVMAHKGFWVQVVIDDWVSLEPSRARSELAMHALLEVLAALGTEENKPKRVPPCQALPVVGVAIDVRDFSMGVTAARAAALLGEVTALRSLGVGAPVPLRDAQRITGRLNFAHDVIPLSRPYLFSLFRWLASATRHTHGTCVITHEVMDALAWWMLVLSGPTHRLRVSMLTGIDSPLEFETGTSTDASDHGWGIVWAPRRLFSMGRWTDWQAALLSINARELATIAMLCTAYGPWLAHRRVVVAVDSEVSYASLVAGGSDNVALRMLTWIVYWAQEQHTFRLVPRWIPGVQNVRADQVSRGRSLLEHDPVASEQSSGDPPPWSVHPVGPEALEAFTLAFSPTCTTKQVLYERLEQHWFGGVSFASSTACGTSHTLWDPNCAPLKVVPALPLSL